MSDSTSVAVRRSTAADRDMLASVLADAFRDDLVFLHLLPLGIRRREARLQRSFDLEVPRSVGLGGAWISTDGAGAAIWYPPGNWNLQSGRSCVRCPHWRGSSVCTQVVPGGCRAERRHRDSLAAAD